MDEVAAVVARIDELAGLAGLHASDVLEEAEQRLRTHIELLLTPGTPWFEAEAPSLDRYWRYLEALTGREWSFQEVSTRYELLRAPSDTRESIPASMRYEVLVRDESTCRKCGRKAPQVPVHVDHVLPWSLGGPTVPENLQVLCDECNAGKSNRYVEEG